MRLLIHAALKNRQHYILLSFTLLSMVALNCADAMEALSVGVLAKSGSLPTTEGGFLDRVIAYFSSIFHFNTILGLAQFLVLVALFKGLSSFFSSYVSSLVSIRVSRDLRQRYFEHMQTLSLSFYQKYTIGNLASRIAGDASVIASSINAMLLNYVQTPLKVCGVLWICFNISKELSFVSFFALPLMAWPIVFFARRVKKIAKQMQSNQENFTSSLVDFLGGIHTIKSFGKEAFAGRKYFQHNANMACLQEKNARYSHSARPVLHLLSSMSIATLCLYGFYFAKMDMAKMLTFCAFLYQLYEPIKKFNDANIEIQKGVAAAERMFEVLDIRPAIQDEKGAVPLESFNHSIEFDGVWFRYEEQWVLQDVSFRIKKGQTVALVGATGAGKSTVIQLLMRLYEVQKGEIRIDGKPLSSFTQSSLRKIFGFVPQKPFLFLDTVAQNIAFGENVKLEQIQTSAKRAHAEEFIVSLPQGYDTPLAEGGRNLSGGQQQRLAIARALVKEAPFLILDEATSSLDTVSEQYIKQAIADLHGSVTQVLIAHRLSTIEHADRILFFDKGKLAAQGSREELLHSAPQFRLLWELNFQTAH